MSHSVKEERLISHNVDSADIMRTAESIKQKIIQQGDKPHTSVKQQLDILDQLIQFDFGRFLLQNRGVNGYWTHYMLTHPWFGRKTGLNNNNEPLGELERFILDRSPLMLATQQRFEIFLKENQQAVANDATLACIPSGMMGELLYLDYTGIENITLTGIDYDEATLLDATTLAEQQNLNQHCEFTKKDAWDLAIENKFDLISSNGLNIYEPDSEKVRALYQQFYNALKPNGKLVTSFITHPPIGEHDCEWNMSQIHQKDLLMQRILFMDILEPKFQCYSSSKETQQQLKSVGFTHVECIYDNAKIFPTVVAWK